MNISGYLINPDGSSLAFTNGVGASNSFVSNWLDKRSAPWVAISVVLRGTGTIAGTLTLETSNIDERQGGKYGGPDQGLSGSLGTVSNGLATPHNTTNPDDYLTYGGSIAVAQSMTTPYHFDLTSPCASHWMRVRYVATTSASGMTVSAYYNGCLSS